MYQASLAIVLAGVLICGCSDSSDETAGGVRAPTTVALWERFDVTLDRPVTESNPFDPAQIAVVGEFRSPQGQLRNVDGFVSRDFTRALQDGREVLQPTSDLQWKIRFTPTEPGTWHWRWRVVTPQGTEEGPWSALAVGPPRGAHGFVRRSPDPRYLEFDDGTPFWAVGENLAWYDARGTFAYDTWMARLAAQGCNYVRLWMPSWAFGLEWIERNDRGDIVASTLGDYTGRLDRAWQLDYVIDLAHRLGIFVMLSVQNHGAFSLVSNSEWQDNPYNAANGGPLEHPREFFTDPQARALFERRLRYIVARWGSAPAIMAWELWNEVDLVEQPALEEVVAWHREMAAAIRAADPNRHLLSTSIADAISASPLTALWSLDEIDFTQIHLYSFEGANTDFTEVLPRVAARLRGLQKPVLIAEADVDFRGPDEDLHADPAGDGFHDILWAGLASETFGSGMAWWWDNVHDPADQYFHFGPLAQVTAGIDFPAEAFVAAVTSTAADDGRPLRIHVLSGRNTVVAWIKNAAHQWFAPDPQPVSGGRMQLEGLSDPAWAVTWVDTRTGATLHGTDLVPIAGSATLEVPVFSADIALRLDRRG